MQRILSQLRHDEEFARRRDHHRLLWAQCAQRTANVQAPLGAAAPGKWPVRRRIEALLDPQSPFLELSALAGCTDPQCPPGGGIVTGIGQIAGRTCMVVANDWQAKGGTYQPATLQKHLRAQAVAQAQQLPCIYLVDSGGIFLPRQAELFAGEHHFGRMFANQARMSAMGIPQIAVVLGMCTAGGAYVPAMADESILVRGQGTIFLAGPALVRAATGEVVDAQTLGGADTHGLHSGLVDHVAADEAEAIALCQEVVAALGRPSERADARMVHPSDIPPQPPQCDVEELAGILPVDPRAALSMHEVIARLVDGSAWRPFKPEYGPELLCATAFIEGQQVGLVANDGVLAGAAAQKGAHFVRLCQQRQTPLLFVQNTTGFLVGAQAEAQGIAKDGAQMVQAVACATVPKITLIVGGSYGAGNYAMCGRGLGPDFVFSWPNARVGVMGAQQAADVLGELTAQRARRSKAPLSAEALHDLIEPIRERYEQEASAYHATSELWDDGILLPTKTRRALALAFACCRRRAVADAPQPVTRP